MKELRESELIAIVSSRISRVRYPKVSNWSPMNSLSLISDPPEMKIDNSHNLLGVFDALIDFLTEAVRNDLTPHDSDSYRLHRSRQEPKRIERYLMLPHFGL